MSTGGNNDVNSTLLITADSTKGTKVNAGVVAKPFRDEIKRKVERLRSNGIEAPLLVGLLANRDPAAKKYAEWTGKACRADGLRYELRELQDPIDVEAALIQANEDPNVSGIIVYYPIFGQEESFSGSSQDDYLRDTVSYQCDVEGLCHTYRSSLYRNIRYLDGVQQQHKCLLPCTALSVVKILEQCPGVYDQSKPMGKHLEGKIITVINRSEIVGRPLAAMLANDGAHVYSIDINSIILLKGGRLYKCSEEETPESCVRKSTVVITGVPVKEYRLPVEWIQEQTTVVNVSSFKNVDETKLLEIPGVVYVPLVGKVTVAMLERNLMRLFEQFHSDHAHEQSQLQRRRKSSLLSPLFPMIGGNQQLQQQKNDNITILQQPWYGSPLNIFTAAAVSLLLVLELSRKEA